MSELAAWFPTYGARRGAGSGGDLFSSMLSDWPLMPPTHSMLGSGGRGLMTATLATDMVDCKDRFEARVEVPGLTKDQLEINANAEKGLLTIKATAESESKNVEEDWIYRERKWGSVDRTLQLPGGRDVIDYEKISGKVENGVLTVVLPKMPVAKSGASHSMPVKIQ
eukprot:SRR837773.691.p2 GENE.SRR837773.691~~SRR837773.691.p2  ORF type:complete len:167 (+),score=50.96 SRR837773.691:85-585(+)